MRKKASPVQVQFEVYIYSDIKVFVFPPYRGRGLWLARTGGGAHDPDLWAVDADNREDVIRFAKAAAANPALR